MGVEIGVDLQEWERYALALERFGTAEGREVVDALCAEGRIGLWRLPGPTRVDVNLDDLAKNYAGVLAEPDSAINNKLPLILALERHGTPEMAAAFIRSGGRDVAIGAAEWAARKGKKEEVKALLTEERQRRIVDDPALLYGVPALERRAEMRW